MCVYPYRGTTPRLGDGVFLAPGARVIGEVDVGRHTSIWFNSVVRGDVNSICIGERTSIQDGCVLHVTHRLHQLDIGSGVVVGHGAVLHGCRVGDGALIGIGARILDGAVVEAGAQIGAGSVVTPGTSISGGHLAYGTPARVVRPLGKAERVEIGAIAERYVELKETYGATLGWGREVVEGTLPGTEQEA